jgi:hypothetical protein
VPQRLLQAPMFWLGGHDCPLKDILPPSSPYHHTVRQREISTSIAAAIRAASQRVENFALLGDYPKWAEAASKVVDHTIRLLTFKSSWSSSNNLPGCRSIKDELAHLSELEINYWQIVNQSTYDSAQIHVEKWFKDNHATLRKIDILAEFNLGVQEDLSGKPPSTLFGKLWLDDDELAERIPILNQWKDLLSCRLSSSAHTPPSSTLATVPPLLPQLSSTTFTVESPEPSDANSLLTSPPEEVIAAQPASPPSLPAPPRPSLPEAVALPSSPPVAAESPGHVSTDGHSCIMPPSTLSRTRTVHLDLPIPGCNGPSVAPPPLLDQVYGTRASQGAAPVAYWRSKRGV